MKLSAGHRRRRQISSSLSFFRRNMSAESTGVGIFYLISSITFIYLNILTILAIIKDAKLSKMPCYRIVIALSVSDIGQMIMNGFLAGIYSLSETTFNYSFTRVCGDILNSCWYASTSLTITLTINRFLTVCFTTKTKRFFEGRKTFIWIGACYCYAFVMFIIYMALDIIMAYDYTIHVWVYGIGSVTEVASYYNVGNNALTNLILLVLYCGIAGKLKVCHFVQPKNVICFAPSFWVLFIEPTKCNFVS